MVGARGDSPSGGHAFLSGGGEMGDRIRALDWSLTSLGPPECWPQSLRSAVSILLPSRAQICLFWGPDFITLYNDAYRPTLGIKHPRSLGQPASEVWREFWADVLRPLLERVRTTGEAFWASDFPFFLERHGYPEETYFDVSYDPVRDESGAVGGVFCIVSETSGRVIGERRLRTLRDLGRVASHARTMDHAFERAAEVLCANPQDVPFALVYRWHDGAERPCIATCNIDAMPAQAWPLERAVEGELVLEGAALRAHAPLPGGPWPEAPRAVVILPLVMPGQRPFGLLVCGISPRRELDESYRDFLRLAAASIAAAAGAAHALEEQRARAEALAEIDRLKTAFFSNVSHEFRTPLTLLLGPVEQAANDTQVPAATRSQLALAHRNALRLLKLVNSLLDFARIEAGRMEASYEPADLAAHTRDLASSFRSAIERAGLRFDVHCDDIGEPVHVDTQMYEKIVLNLLSNAFKFTLEGGITVRLRREDSTAVLEIADTGVGVPEGELPRLFERFHRVQGTAGRTQEGSGIGLALVQELVKLHGGSIEVTSKPVHGTCFRLRLPLGTAHLPQERIGAARALGSTAIGANAFVQEALRWIPGPDAPVATTLVETPAPARRHVKAAGARILVADDNADMRAYLRDLLQPGYGVDVVANGEEALAAARHRRPDLILTDIMMPRLDGLQLLKALRADRELRDIPVILLSARAGEEARVQGLDAGADDYLVKPFAARELLARVGSLLELTALRRENEQRLREADHRKDEFLALLGHELRNPLSPISTASDLLMRIPGNDPQVRAAADMIRRQAAQLTRLVDDLLDVGRITQGRIQLQRQPLELAGVIRQAMETVEALFAQKRHEVSLDLGDAPYHVHGDAARLVQCVANLLSNAAKYTDPRGRIRIETRAEGPDVVIEITDTGAGIAPELLPRVFDLFVQGDRTLDRAHGGLGIGLSVVRQLIGMHDGTVTARSAGAGQGSTFRIRLPRIPAPARPRAAAEPATAARRVLIVDDNVDAADALSLLLDAAGHQTRVAYSGPQALDCVEAFHPDVGLLDIGLPGMSGYELARHLRGIAHLKSMRLIALTGYGQAGDRDNALAAGFDDHLVKPADFEALQRIVGRNAGLAPEPLP